MPTVSMLQKAIWALSLCPVDAGGTLLPPLRVLEGARLSSDRDRRAATSHDAKRRVHENLGFAPPISLACCGTDSIG